MGEIANPFSTDFSLTTWVVSRPDQRPPKAKEVPPQASWSMDQWEICKKDWHQASGLSEVPEEVYSYGWSTGQPTTPQIYPLSELKVKKRSRNRGSHDSKDLCCDPEVVLLLVLELRGISQDKRSKRKIPIEPVRIYPVILPELRSKGSSTSLLNEELKDLRILKVTG